MDAESPIDGQFSKLHPCFDPKTRIAIVGAGPSGLSAAYALAKLGYSNVTVFEKQNSPGGMCESVDVEGKIYDLGGQVLAANSAPSIFHLAEQVGAEMEDMDGHKLALLDSSTGVFSEMNLVEDYVSLISLTLKLQDKSNKSGKIGVHAISDIAPESAAEFLKKQGFSAIPKSVICGYTASGYGYVQDMPYAYLHEFTRTSMAGKIRRFKGGYMSLWEKLSAKLPVEVCCNTEVVSVKRDSSKIAIQIKTENELIQEREFDKIIISGAFPFTTGKTYRSSLEHKEEESSGLIDTTELEKEMFRKVHTIDYYTTVFKIKGLDHIPKGFYYFDEFMVDPATMGNPVAMQRFYEDTNIFLFWSYGNSKDIQGEEVARQIIAAVKRMGAEIESMVLQRRFKYFPHVTSEDMKNGFYDKLEFLLQGQNNTYFVGGLLAFELTERNSAYSMALIRKHFAEDSYEPKYPYVKRLLTLKSDQEDFTCVKQNESTEVQFPDLPALDAYLKYWGTSDVTQNKVLYTWINEDGHIVAQRTYKELNSNASKIAEKLISCNKPTMKIGDRVLLIYVPGLDFIDAFFGCLRAGVVPVPVIPPDPSQKGRQSLLHISNIAKSCNPVAILSTLSYHIAVKAASASNIFALKGRDKSYPGWPNLPWLHTDIWIKKSKISFSVSHTSLNYEPSSQDLCFLQFTSGSTGEPKGVMITQSGLIHNVKMMKIRYQSTANTVLVSWLPQYHDMGLIGGIFTSMVSGGSAILFSPIAFIRKPLLWLQTINRYRATHSAGPNFAFELLVRKLEMNKSAKFDLSSMVFLMVAAEPIRAQTLRKFLKLTQPFGLSQKVIAPGYGLAENCVYVCSAYEENNDIWIDWQDRVCCGYINPNNEADVIIKIIQRDTGKECENSEEGEIWISSPSAGSGYWGRKEITRSTFQNYLSEYPERKFIRTGDLGRIIEGKFFVTGRIKDLIIVGGRNIYSSDIEKTVENSCELVKPGCCAAIGVPNEILLSKGMHTFEDTNQEGLVVIAEVRETKSISNDTIKHIQNCVVEEHGIIPSAIIFIRPRTISKTTSGKIKRYDCLKKFIDDSLDVVQGPFLDRENSDLFQDVAIEAENLRIRPQKDSILSRADIMRFLIVLVSEMTEVSITKISTKESLLCYGIHSIGVVRAAQKLSDFLNVPVSAIDIFTATCIDDLADFAYNLLSKSRLHSCDDASIKEKQKTANIAEPSSRHKLQIWLLQLAGLGYICFLLVLPAYISISFFKSWISIEDSMQRSNFIDYVIILLMAPLSWMLCVAGTCVCIALFGTPFLQPNYALNSEVSVWTVEFVKWWTLAKVQEISSKNLAIHLRGTIFINFWFKMFGAKIATSSLIDTIDITDPTLVSIGENTVLAEGAMLQCHEIKNGTLSLSPIKIGEKCSVGPYALLQRGTVVEDAHEVNALTSSVQTKSTSQIQTFHNGLPLYAPITHFFGIWGTGFMGSLSGAIMYILYIWLLHKQPTMQEFAFACAFGAYHWIPYIIIAYYSMVSGYQTSSVKFAIYLATAYTLYGIILSFLTGLVRYCISRRVNKSMTPIISWFLHRIVIATHVRFAKFLSGTEAFCWYLRLMGSKIGNHCSIRGINAISHPDLVSIADGVHLGDFCRLVPGYYSLNGYISKIIEMKENSVVGSQSLILPGSIIERDVILGALSVAAENTTHQRGGVFVGTPKAIMVKSTLDSIDDRILEIDAQYKKVLENLAANFASSTLKVNSRLIHRVGASGRGILKLYDELPNLPDHEIFSPGKNYSIILRHSNALSSDDDAILDGRGASIRILSDHSDIKSSLLDLTLKTGNAFHARTIGDFAIWVSSGTTAREEYVKHAPHIRDALWESVKKTDTYTKLHYYSNISRLFRFKDGQEMYVKFKLRPYDEKLGEDTGKAEPTSIIPPEPSANSRDECYKCPKLFLADDFRKRILSPERVRYILQLQMRPIPSDETAQEVILDCTRPWHESKFPHFDIGEILIDQLLTEEESESLEFNPFLRCREIDVIRATSCTQSASLDHGRSVVYEICQHLRNKKPLPECWKRFIDQSDVKVNFSGCPMAATLEMNTIKEVTLARPWHVTLWLTFVQPLLQIFLPYFLLSFAIFPMMNFTFYLNQIKKSEMYFLLPFFWLSSGILAGILFVLCKWALVVRKKSGKVEQIWSASIFMDTLWQAIKMLVEEYFLGMCSGSVIFNIWMKLMGSDVAWDKGVYIDSHGAALNPELVKVEDYGSVGREALLFGHIYEGDKGRVKYGKVVIKKGGYVGSRAMAMPGVTVAAGGALNPLSLAMKEELVN